MLLPALLLAFLIAPSLAWTVPAYMDLVWPPRWTTDIGDAYHVKNGKPQPGYTNSAGSCFNKPVPANVTRTLFPITGGGFIFGFVNNSQSYTGTFRVDMYLTDEPFGAHEAFQPGFARRMQFWEGFATGMTCTVPYDMTARLEDPNNATAVASLDGHNFTVAALVINERGREGVFEEVDQCAYITLTSKKIMQHRDTNKEVCNRVELDYFGSKSHPGGHDSMASRKDVRTAAYVSFGIAVLVASYWP